MKTVDVGWTCCLDKYTVPFYTNKIPKHEPVNNSMLKNKWLWAVVIVVIASGLWYAKPWHSAPADATPTEQTDG